MIPADDYRFLCGLLLAANGLSIREDKQYLIERRLSPVARSLGFADLAALVRALREKPDPDTARLVCEAMTTSESLFFRDGKPFDFLRDRILPELLATRRASRRLRFWSAGTATGQEAYSIAMLLADLDPRPAGWSFEILATDYSRAVLERARAGRYNHFEVQRGLPAHYLSRYFTPVDGGWQIADRIRRAVQFREGNLLEPFDDLGTFDVIFCRNVLIYMEASARRGVIERLASALRPDGYLFLGAAELPFGLTDRIEPVRGAGTAVYRPRPAAAVRARA